MSRFTTDRQEPRRQRFSGPWSPNPWFNLHRIGPHNHQDTHQLQMQAVPPTPYEVPWPQMEPGAAPDQRRTDRKEQWTALKRWQDEGGQNI